MACWHVCRTFTGSRIGEIRMNHFDCESWGNLSSPTYPQYHYIMSSIPTEYGSLENFTHFFSYSFVNLIRVFFQRAFSIIQFKSCFMNILALILTYVYFRYSVLLLS